jgi:pyruvate ferredoxin oxidoreductase alpha subunit
VPDLAAVREFLPAYAPTHARFSAAHAMAQGVAVLGGSAYTFFKYQMHRAAEAALGVHDAVTTEFCNRFGRCYGAVDSYRLDDADWVIVMSNSFSTTGKAEVARLRARGEKVGLLRLRLIRPFPQEEIQWLLDGRRAVAVIDQNISLGKGGILFAEVASALHNATAPPLLSFIGGLGGRRFRGCDFDEIVAALHAAEHSGGSFAPRLLFTADEYGQIGEMLRIAHGAVPSPAGGLGSD